MGRRGKERRGHDSLPLLNGCGEEIYPSGKACPLVIGATDGHERRVYCEDSAGNLLISGSISLADSWWGLHYGPDGGGGVIVGRCPAMVVCFQRMIRLAGGGEPILLTGPTGAGKEQVVRAFAATVEGPYVPVLCAGLSEALFESELFGHVQGAFTGADNSVPGWVAMAERGLLYFDEIAEISLRIQVKLLRFLEGGEFTPVGGRTRCWAHTWTVVSTNRCLEEEVRAGRFREDLYYRIASTAISLPSLHERGDDVLLLATYFILKNNAAGKRKVTVLDRAAVAGLRQYPWPGNVRELENTVKRAYRVGSGPVFRAEELPDGRALQLGTTCSMALSSQAARPPRSNSKTRRTIDDLHILHYLQRLRKTVTVADVAKEFGIPEWTIQRCFRRLIDSGNARRTSVGTQRLYSASLPSTSELDGQEHPQGDSLSRTPPCVFPYNSRDVQPKTIPGNGEGLRLSMETG
jgi:DNA-binding NtrC family response regulator